MKVLEPAGGPLSLDGGRGKAGEKPRPALVEARDVFKIFREGAVETVALRGANLELKRGQVTSLVGPSGSGKSSLVSILAGLSLPSAGQVLFDGEDMTRLDEAGRARLRARRIGIVLQSGNLVPFLSAYENVKLAIKLAGGRRAGPRARDLLGELGLGARLHHLPRRLSGGEAQRVSVAAALANQPDLLLADEVTGELDTATADQVMEVMMDAWRQRGLTVLLVTHNLDIADRAQHRLRLVDGEVTLVSSVPTVPARTGTSPSPPPKPEPMRPAPAAEKQPPSASPSTHLTFLNLGNPTGLKFMVEWEGFRAIFDFGLEHAPGRAPFSMGLDPRPGRELQDLIAVGAAPRLDGVYDSWDGHTGVFISHLHLDHTSLVPFLHPDVPLYYPAAMEPLRTAAAACGEVPWRRRTGIPVPDQHLVRGPGINVRFLAVDHDLPGATGFLIETPDLTIAYTGDHRWHGLHPELTESFAESVRGVDVLIQESVSLGFLPTSPERGEEPPAPQLSEAEVLAGFERVLAETAGLVVVNLPGMNRERVAGLAEACARTGRRLLMEPDSATLAGWEGVLDDAEPVRADPRGHCVQLKFQGLPTLIDLAPPPGSAYVHSNGSPLGRYDPRWVVMEAWCSLFGLEFIRLSSSGHSRPEDIVRMVDTVRPGLVIPVHSQAPEALEVRGVPRLLAEANRPYSAEELLSLAGSGEGNRALHGSQRSRPNRAGFIGTARTRLLNR